ncbi:MAG: hypothetical protein WCI36_02060 [bacterium]
MPQKNTNKTKDVIKELEKTISPILVVNNSTLKPYLELFEYEPENIYQQPLGCLVGFFEIKEFSQESAYVVNFLTSVLKKEYYINPKRPVTESLDSALHKVNMALSELAKHGNIEWLGKINAAICVLEKNNTHFSVSGDAKIFLYRKQNLSEISEDLASDSLDPHPLKTFVNVSSGRLEKDDRILITSADIFHILSAVEIKKNLQRFEGDKFVQFLKTALSNQLEMIASIVVQMSDQPAIEETKKVAMQKPLQTVNAFSQQAFETAAKTDATILEQEAEMAAEIQADPEYTDQKTGHIYVQGETNENNESSNSQMNLYWDIVKEKISQGSYVTKNEIRRRVSLYKNQLAKKKELRRIEKEKQEQLAAEEKIRLEKQRALEEIEREEMLAKQKEETRIREQQEFEQEQIRLKQEQIVAAQLKRKEAIVAKRQAMKLPIKNETVIAVPNDPQSSFLEKLRQARLEQQRSAVIDLSVKKKESEFEEVLNDEDPSENFVSIHHSTAKSNENKIEKAKEISLNFFELAKTNTLNLIKKTRSTNFAKTHDFSAITPHFSKIKKLFSRFSTKQKTYTIGALFLVFVVPLFIVHFLNKPKPQVAPEIKVIPKTQAELLSGEKNINTNAKIQTILPNQKIITTLMAIGNPTIITKNSVIVLSNNQLKEFALPINSGSPISATYMNDLSLVIIITDEGKVLSFSPISTKFSENKIELSNISSSTFIGTYLTYLYILDQKNNQIYRFPRADGGFGDSTKWLKDGTSLEGVSGITIDDNIYAISKNQVLKFFKGQKQAFSLENSTTPIHFDKIYTTPELSAIYALDTQNSRLITFSKEGSILGQYYNESLKNGTSISIDEQNKTAYISTAEGLLSMSL